MRLVRLLLWAAVLAALLFAGVPAAAGSGDCPPTDPACLPVPPGSIQVNPDPLSASGAPAGVEAPGILMPVEAVLPMPAPQIAVAPLDEKTGPSFSSLSVPLRFQDPSDVSCGVQALGMALDALPGGPPTSSALLGFLQGNGMMYDFGTGVDELAYAAQSFGYKGSYAFHGASIADLSSQLASGSPVVVSLGSNGEGQPGHFVTVTGISSDGRLVSYNDPTQGEVVVSADEFMRLWGLQGNSGVAVAAEPPASAPDLMPWVALSAAIMALVSTTPFGAQRMGVGGRIDSGGGSSLKKPAPKAAPKPAPKPAPKAAPKPAAKPSPASLAPAPSVIAKPASLPPMPATAPAPSLFSQISSAISSAVSTVTTAVRSTVSTATTAVRNTVNQVTSAVSSTVGRVASAVSTTVNRAAAIVDDIAEEARQIGRSVATTAATTVSTAVRTTAQAVGNTVRAAATSAVSTVRTVAVTALTAAHDAVEAATPVAQQIVAAPFIAAHDFVTRASGGAQAILDGTSAVVEALRETNEERNPRFSERMGVLQAVGDGLSNFGENWGAILSMAAIARQYTGDAILQGRWEDAGRGLSGIGQMNTTLAQFGAQVGTSMLLSPFTSAWEFGSAVRERVFEGEGRELDVVMTGGDLALSLLGVYGAYSAARSVGVVERVNGLSTGRLAGQIDAAVPEEALPSLLEQHYGTEVPLEVRSRFAGWQVQDEDFTSADILRRYHTAMDQGGNAYGPWWTPELPASEIQFRMDMGVKPEWNAAAEMSVLAIPEGETLGGLSGPAAYVDGIYVGGGRQVYLAPGSIPREWVTTGPVPWSTPGGVAP